MTETKTMRKFDREQRALAKRIAAALIDGSDIGAAYMTYESSGFKPLTTLRQLGTALEKDYPLHLYRRPKRNLLAAAWKLLTSRKERATY